jgi:hypothetical protein
MDVAGVRSDYWPNVLRPTPPRLEDSPPDRKFTQCDKFDASLLDHSHFVGLIESLPAELHDLIVRISPYRSPVRPAEVDVDVATLLVL